MERESVAPTVLIVEDEWLIRADIVYEFHAAGWVTLEAGSGEEALTILREGRQIDVLVTDIRLSGALSGWDVAQAFRRAKGDIPEPPRRPFTRLTTVECGVAMAPDGPGPDRLRYRSSAAAWRIPATDRVCVS
jgi:CheY-like chemotaxis protein